MKRKRTEQEKAVRRWINHYRQRRLLVYSRVHVPANAPNDQWRAYLKWVNAYGRNARV